MAALALAIGVLVAKQVVSTLQRAPSSTLPEVRLWERVLDDPMPPPGDLLGDSSPGTVVIEVMVDKDGTVATSRPSEAPDMVVARRVSHAVRQWRFRSSTGTVHGKLTFILRRDAGEAAVEAPGRVMRRDLRIGTDRLTSGWALPAIATVVPRQRFLKRLRVESGLSLDLRSEADFNRAPSAARNVPLERLEEYLATTEIRGVILLDCTSGLPHNCALASWSLARRGADEVVIGATTEDTPVADGRMEGR